jgi:Na+:H+ antiporter, NhaB family
MGTSTTQALGAAFLGDAPRWYKNTILLCLVLNPVLFVLDPYTAGWALVLEFIFTLAMALRCYPLQPGGLLTLEAVAIGMTTPERVFAETAGAIEVVLLLIFMVAGIYFLKDLLRLTFTKILVRVRSKLVLSLLFSLVAAFLSAFLDALTVVAVVLTVATAFYGVYHRVMSGRHAHDADHDHASDGALSATTREDLDGFRAFLRSVVMHAAVGTALGGVATLVGEPQNLLIGTIVGWDFREFFVRMAPVSLPVLGVGFATCLLLERFRWFGYGAELPANVRAVLEEFERDDSARRSSPERARLWVQGIVAVFLIVALAFHWAKVGLIGLTVIVLATAFTGITEEHRLGRAFQEALPFTALLVVFFGIVAVIHDQGLFEPLVAAVLALPAQSQPAALYLANGLLSAISDNVFVATIYIDQVFSAYEAGTIDRAQFELLAVAINTGTNIPSVATPNGQAAFLFLLTSALAPLIRLSYLRMVVMALPYFVTMTATGLAAVVWWL